MNPDQAKALREPFDEAVIGQLPRTICRECSDSRNGVCEKHTKTRCDGSVKDLPRGCGNYMTTQHIHLDYVGHAAVTDRLLQVDPEWYWEPAATDPNTGAPLKADGGLWIKLTICGMTRYGWGDGKSIKECIGDAIRNAAMRFGVALDLWAKEDLHAAPPVNPAEPADIIDLTDRMNALPEQLKREVKIKFKQDYGHPDDLTTSQLPYATALVIEYEQKANGDVPRETPPTAPEAYDGDGPGADERDDGDASARRPSPPEPTPEPAPADAERMDWKAVGKEQGLSQLKVLTLARHVAVEAGLEAPGSLQKVSDAIEVELMALLLDKARREQVLDELTAAVAATG